MHTGTGATAIPITAKAYIVLEGGGTVTITGPWGSFAANRPPVGVIIPIEITAIELNTASDEVLLLW